MTIGVDWMEKEIGVKMAELLAIPPTVVPDAVTEDAVDPYTPDAPSDGLDKPATEAEKAYAYGLPDWYDKTQFREANPGVVLPGDPGYTKKGDPVLPIWHEPKPEK